MLENTQTTEPPLSIWTSDRRNVVRRIFIPGTGLTVKTLEATIQGALKQEFGETGPFQIDKLRDGERRELEVAVVVQYDLSESQGIGVFLDQFFKDRKDVRQFYSRAPHYLKLN